MDVAIYESSLLGFSLLTHANAVLPASLDRVLRWIVITPDWHRVHHSIHRDEMNANFGNLLSIWDRLFGTAREGPRDGHVAMAIGLPEFRAPQAQRFPALLIQPFMSTSVDTAPP
ncbi:MAG: sterol desaturase family protein [Proteobacteria bacterium]|nr:sterol desaturase family protein [Pseudomonadota bacterium]